MIRHRAVLDAVRDAIFLADIETGMILDANPAAEALCGRSLAELRSLHHNQLHPPEAAEWARNMFDQHTRVPGLTEGHVLHKDGHRIPVEISASHFTASNGQRMLVGVFRDTTERNEAREAVRRSEERFRQVAESAGEFIWEVDANGLYLYANPVIRQILGYTPDEVVGRMHFYDLFAPETREETKTAAFEVFARREEFRAFPNLNVTKDGRVVALETNGLPILDGNGNLLGYRGADTDVTERRQAEQALQDSESHARAQAAELRAIMDAAPTAIFIAHDTECRHISGNRTAHALLGQPPGSNLSKSAPQSERPANFRVLRDGVEIPAQDLPIQWAARTGQPVRNCELEVVFEDGISTDLVANVEPVLDDNGRPQGAVGVLSDITERKRAEETLRENADRLALILEATSGGVWDWNIPSGHAVFSPRYSTMLGYEPEEFAKSYGSWKSIVHPDDFERVNQHHADHFAGQTDFSIEFRMREKSGNWHWIHSRGLLIERDAEGRPVRMVGTHSDIQERKRAEEALRESEARLKNAERIAHVGNWHWDISVNHVTCSEETWRILGSPQDYTSGFEGFLQTVIPQDRERVYQWGKDCVKEKRGNSIEFQIARSNVDLRTVSCTSEVLLNEDGLPVHMVGTCQDVTDFRRAEAALRQSRDEIAHLNRVAAMAELAGSLAHELNQPLAAILLNSQAASGFLSGKPPNLARARDCLNAIAADDERAGEVIQRLRGLIKKGESRASLIYVNEVVSDALRLMENDALLRQVSVKFEPLPGLPPVLGDRIQLYQVVLNLIVNGLDAAAERPPEDRWVLVRAIEADGGGVELTVEDSGNGIAEGDLARVFEPFFTTKREGLGMGLSISRSIVQAHGGRIWAENRAGGGAIFRFSLPVAQQATAASAK